MVRKSVLPNGITVMTDSMPHVKSVSLGVWLKTGSRHEPERLAGISHYIEHMVFKGTKTRSARDIALAIDEIGGAFDAFTSRQHTCFYFRVLSDHLPFAVDLVSDIVLNPLFTPSDMERERAVILEEIRMSEDTPDDYAHQLFSRTLFGKHPLGRPIAGSEKSLKNIDSKTIARYFKERYIPKNIVISLAGDLKHRETVRLIREGFQALKASRSGLCRLAAPKPQAGVAIESKVGLDQVHIFLGGPGLPVTHKDRVAAQVLNLIMGESMSSRLFYRIREQAGLAYSVYSSLQFYPDAGYFEAYAGVSRKNAKKALRMLAHELREVAQNGITADELKKAKTHLKGSVLLSAESVTNHMTRMAMGEIFFGRVAPLAETQKKIRNVTLKDIHRVAKKLYRPENWSLAVLGGPGVKKLRLSRKDLVA